MVWCSVVAYEQPNECLSQDHHISQQQMLTFGELRSNLPLTGILDPCSE